MKWLADECFDNDILRGLSRRSPSFDLICAQDVSEIAGRDDETLLAWAAKNERVVLRMIWPAWSQRADVHATLARLAVVPVPDSLAIGRVIEDVCFSISVRTSQTGLWA